MKDTNTLQRFMFGQESIRGEIIHIESAYQSIINQRAYPPLVKHLLGEALMSCVLLAGSIQFEGEISLQFHGNECLPLLLVQCDHDLNLRGFAKYKDHYETADYARAFLEGKMTLVINQYNQTQAYQSVVPLRSTSMAENLMHYFAQSEQIATRVWLATSDNHAAGMLLQLMPTEDTTQREHFWEYAIKLGETITEEELLSLDNETILYRLYHETEVRLYPSRPIRFRCRCSLDKMKQVLTVLGEQDIQQLLQEQGQVAVNCDFCNKNYTFDPIDITLLFRKP
jgi:molecular chaperone Hsp33